MKENLKLMGLILLLMLNPDGCSLRANSYGRSLHAQIRQIKFDRISLEQGLSESVVFCILQDRQGFMWFGTLDGLNKYDGYRFTIYRHDLLDSNSLSDNDVRSIYEDRSGTLWIGTKGGGLNKFDRDTEQFTRFVNDPQNPHSLSDNNVTSIYEDHTGALWVGTEAGGLNKLVLSPASSGGEGSDRLNSPLKTFNEKSGQFTRFVNDPKNPHSLSNNHVTSIYKDHAGVLWIGTSGGGLNKLVLSPASSGGEGPDRPDSLLKKFNEKSGQFIHFVNDPKNPHSLSDNGVMSIYEDHSGTLWIGTWGGGLNKFDHPDSPLKKFNGKSGQFIRFVNDPKNPSTLSHNTIRSIYEDHTGTLWIGTWGGGLNKFDRDTEQFTRFVNDPRNPHSLSDNDVMSIYEDRSGTLWIGTDGGGLNKNDHDQKQFIHFVNDPNNPHSLNDNDVLSIYKSRQGRDRTLWIGTRGGGLNRLVLSPASSGGEGSGRPDSPLKKFNEKSGQFTHFVNDPKNPHSLSNNDVRSIYEDHTGTLWVGTRSGGLNRLVLSPASSRGEGSDRPDALLKKFNGRSGQFARFVNDPKNPHSLSNNDVRAIYEDHSGVLWIGTWGGGLNKFDRDTGQFTRFVNDPQNPHSLSDNEVRSIYESRQALPSPQGMGRDGTLWIGTASGGLNKFDRDTGQFTRFVNDPKNPHSLSDNDVRSIYEDHAGTLWIGTAGGGLNRLVPSLASREGEGSHRSESPLKKFNGKSEQFIYYTEKDGLPNNVIYGILEDDHGHLWLSTNKGVSRFDPQSKVFKNYDVADGLQSNEFNSGAFHKSRSGEMFFGGINGFNMFHPDSVKDNPNVPPVVITAFKRYNTDDDDTEGIAIEEKGISEKQQITLSYKDNIFSFEFAALSFSHPEKNQYAYKLEGYSDKWIQLATERRVTFTNLDPGDYTLRVKGSNNDGIWNEEGTSLKITITSPWWKTRLAYTLYVMLLIAGIVVTNRLQRRRVIQKERARAQFREAELRAQAAEAQAQALQAENERKELELLKTAELKAAYQALGEAHEHLKATQEQLIHAAKMASLGQLTAGIAHEIKNPLNFVNNFAVLTLDLTKELHEALEAPKDKWDEKVQANVQEVLQLLDQNVAKINEHGRRADNIVKDMLLHSRGESGERRPADLNAILDEYVMLAYHGMRGTDSTFNIKIEKEYDASIGRVEVFPQDLSRVFLNLVNNACYATHEKKKALGDSYSPVLSVHTKNLGDKVEIRIRDNGNGIPLDIRDKIFNPFFTTKPAGQGTGLGLSISYDIIVQEHRGEITVETEEGKFTEFVLRLPVVDDKGR